MSGMNEFLAAYYGTGGTISSQPASEEVEKRAQIQLFAKLAAEQNIDLENLPEDQVAKLWANFQKQASGVKLAEEDKKPEDDKSKKMDDAKKELEEKKAAAEKLSEADFLGRVMAHSYVDELKKIAAAQAEPEPAKEAEAKDEKKDEDDDTKKEKEAAMPEHLRKALAGVKGKASAGAAKAKEMAGAASGKAKEMAGKASDAAKKHPGASHAAAGAAGAVAGGAIGAAAMKKKKASALDELACETALNKVAEAGFDLDEAATRLAAVLELPASENTKVAAAPDLPSAIEFRSLELLEQAGYPVTWNDA